MVESEEAQSMADVIKDLIRRYREKKETRLLKGINSKFMSLMKNPGNENLREEVGLIGKNKKARDQTQLEFQGSQLNRLRSIASSASSICSGEVQNIIDEYHKSLDQIKEEHEVVHWLNKVVTNASSVSFATHVVKLTHSSIKNASNVYDRSTEISPHYLTTSSLSRHRPRDVASDNAKFSPTVKLLQLAYKDMSLLDLIENGDRSAFSSFTDDQEVIDNWMMSLKQALDSQRKSSHFLAKQVYFPVPKNAYHILSLLTSSSMAHSIFNKIKNSINDGFKEARGQKKSGKYSDLVITNYPKKAVIKVTASNHHNASILNNQRGGRIYLLPCLPPEWKAILKPPITKKSMFHGEIGYLSNENGAIAIDRLQKLLLAIKRNKLNKNNPEIYSQLSELVDEVIDQLFDYVSSIQGLKEQAGWSECSHLKVAHQLWLDPNREGEDFQKKRKTWDWQSEICTDFSSWLNKKLEHKKLTLGAPQEALWKKLIKPRLREFVAMTEVEL